MTLSLEESRILGDLASVAIDGRLAAPQQEQLERLLRTSEAARVYYVRFMEISAAMAWAARGPAKIVLPAPRRFPRWRWNLAAAAAILVVAMLGTWLFWQKPPVTPPNSGAVDGVAFLSTAVNLEWEGSEEPLHVGNVLKPDWVKLKSGLAQIELISGASVWLEGPATFRLDSKNGGYFAGGKLVAVAPKGSGGISVDTPLGGVVDRGTGFGIEVTSAKVTVHVFEGVVDVTPTGGVTKSYVAGQSVVLLPGGTILPGLADVTVFDYMGYGWRDGSLAWDWFPHHMRWPLSPPSTWKGGNPLDYIHDQLGVDTARWLVLEPKIAAYLDAQRVVRGEGYPWDNDVTRALWGLELFIMNVNAGDDELSNAIVELREARQVARVKLDSAELVLHQELTITEEVRLVTLGYMK